MAITTNANTLNSPLSSLTIAIKPNPLDSARHRKLRGEIYTKMNKLIFDMRQQKRKTNKNEIYELPPLVKQIIRCLHPSDIDDNSCSQKPDVVFKLRTFIELFRS